MAFRLAVVVLVALALGQPGPPPGAGSSGGGASPPPPPVDASADPPVFASMAQALWALCQSMGPPSGSVPAVAPPSGTGSAPAAEDPPWRRSRSRGPAVPAPPAPPAPAVAPDPPVVVAESAAPVVTTPSAPVVVTESAAPVVPVPSVVSVPDATPKAAATKPPVSLDLRRCRVCNEVAYHGKSLCLNVDCAPWPGVSHSFFIGPKFFVNLWRSYLKISLLLRNCTKPGRQAATNGRSPTEARNDLFGMPKTPSHGRKKKKSGGTQSRPRHCGKAIGKIGRTTVVGAQGHRPHLQAVADGPGLGSAESEWLNPADYYFRMKKERRGGWAWA